MAATHPPETRATEAISPTREAWRQFRRNRPAIAGLVLLGLIVLAVLYGSFLYGGDPYRIVAAPLTAGVAILFEAGLSFLGLGDPNTMSWGIIIGQNRQVLLEAWWPVTLPGLAIFLTVFAIALVGDGINDAFNPKLRSR